MLDLFESFCNCDCSVVKGFLLAAFAVGVFKITTLVLSLGTLLVQAYVLPAVSFAKYGGGKGAWAVITGASDGIGKEYALQLAERGFNIVLVSRTQAKLELVAAEIEGKYKRQTRVVAFDAAEDAPENYAVLAKALEGLPVTILVNNVGQSHAIPVPFLDTSEEEMMRIVTLNNIVTMKITRVVAPVIVANVGKATKLRGLILTMGSFAGLVPSPLLCVYSGSKAFLQNWSTSLAGELKPDGVDVELVISYLVTSAMSKIRRASFTIPNPHRFVASTLRNVGRRVGAQERYATVTPYPAHALMHWGIENSAGVYSKIVNKINFVMHTTIRARALKKAARAAAADTAKKQS
ncbi:hypothetical protein PICMEDRAFT_16993 [Pichia membranifaciens NRRL Y-2026]|uniref:Very-long-chain 3-oxoacyl-CoA reductase n=1 Tax=Pichia membranifaciens NRRL Y-2026 TaxID=763406 RepID=A0A1E3NHV7_9ASCO|nr:hypothetical protein PICMEDRAFT_16993 [Pichia membranifaciens NRRL Y-2026]ODQ45704.1 hypothetical protein PICMEDRAFT_16993 [Pichia membranifaciens NRRL Y-2026]